MIEQHVVANASLVHEPVLTQIMQIEMSERDWLAVNAQIRRVSRVELVPLPRADPVLVDLFLYRRVQFAYHDVNYASAMAGWVKWELIEPLDDESIEAQFLIEKGEGVHHIAATTPEFDEAVAAQARWGNDMALSGTFSSIRVAYLPTDRDLGVILEISDGLSDAKREPDAT